MSRVDDEPDRFPPPRIPAGTIARARLDARLDEPWDALVVIGPAGSGKSTLAAQWARRTSSSIAWLSADGPAGERPSGRRTAPDPRDTASAGASTLDVALALIADPSGPVVVVDGAERLAPVELGALGAALDRAPAARLILLTRTAVSASALAAATSQTVRVIRPDELLLDDAEIAALTRDPERVPGAAAASGRLAVAVRDHVDGDRSRHFERFRHRLLEGLEGLEGLADPGGAGHPAAAGSPYRSTLARLAVVRSVDEDLARELGIEAAELARAQHDGLLLPHDGRLDVTAFAARVLEPLGAELPPEERETALRTALADPRLRRERAHEALRIAVALRDFDAATDLVLERGLLITDEPERIRAALAGVGYADVKHHPILVIVLGQLANLDRSTRLHGLVLFGRAIAGIRTGSSNARPRDAMGFRLLAATLLRLTPAADSALKRSLAALAEIDALNAEERASLGLVGAEGVTHVGLTAMAAGDDATAATMYERAYGEFVELGSIEMLDPLTLRAALAAVRGELPLARDLAATADAAEWPPHWRTGLRGQALALAHAVFAIEEQDPAAAQAHLQSTGPIEDLLEHWAMFAVVQSWRDLLAGEARQGIERVRRIRAHRSRTPTTSVLRARLDVAEAMLLLAVGDPAPARALATSAAKHVPSGFLQLARAQLALGRVGEAHSTLVRLASGAHPPRIALGADLLAATVALREGDERAGDAIALRIAERARATGLRHPFLSIGAEDRELLAASADRVGEHELASVLAGTRPPTPVADLRAPQLTARERAVLAVLAETPSTAVIAERLVVSTNTVKTQLRSVYRKLDANTREQALTRAMALHLLNPASALRAPEAGHGQD